jgi:hypothetical protein
MIETIQFIVLLALLVITVYRSRRVLREVRIYEARTWTLKKEATALAVEVDRRKEAAERAGKLVEDLKARIQKLQDTYVTERRRLVNVRRIPAVSLWILDRNPVATLPLWYLRVTDRTDVRAMRSLASVGSSDTDNNLPELRPAYVVSAPTVDEAQRQLKARLTSLEFDVVDGRPLAAAVTQLTAPRRNAARAG